MPMIREQLNGMLKRDYKKSFMEMTESMHVNAMKGYKRSNIPHPSDVKGEAMLENIKEVSQFYRVNFVDLKRPWCYGKHRQ